MSNCLNTSNSKNIKKLTKQIIATLYTQTFMTKLTPYLQFKKCQKSRFVSNCPQIFVLPISQITRPP